MTNNDIIKKQMLEALTKSLGVVKTACSLVGISRETHYRWTREDENYKLAVENIADEAIDFVESKLFEKINGVTIQSGVDKEGEPIVYDHPPSDTAIIFYLKTKGKKRGYIERQEVDHSGAIELPVTFVLDERFKED